MHLSITLRQLSTAVLALSGIGLTHAQNISTWDGDISGAWATAGNWANAATPGAGGTAIFNSPAVPNQPEAQNSNGERVKHLIFNDAGWTIGADADGYVQMRNVTGVTTSATITSNGSGTNTITRLGTNVATAITTGAGNTLVIQQSQAGGALNLESKGGAGKLVIEATSGGVDNLPDITAGTLILNSTSLAATIQTRTVSGGAVLGGTGVLNHQRNYTYQFLDGSTLAPGALGEGDLSAGTFSFRADTSINVLSTVTVNMQSGSEVAIDIFNDGSSDKILLAGVQSNPKTVVVMNLESNVTLALTGTPVYNTAYTVVEFTGAGQNNATYGAVGAVTLNGNLLTQGVDYTMTYTDHTAFDPGTGSISVTLLMVPEPTAAGLVSAALGLLVVRRRRTVA